MRYLVARFWIWEASLFFYLNVRMRLLLLVHPLIFGAEPELGHYVRVWPKAEPEPDNPEHKVRVRFWFEPGSNQNVYIKFLCHGRTKTIQHRNSELHYFWPTNFAFQLWKRNFIFATSTLQLQLCNFIFATSTLHFNFATSFLQLHFCNFIFATSTLQLHFCNFNFATSFLQLHFCNFNFATSFLQLQFNLAASI